MTRAARAWHVVSGWILAVAAVAWTSLRVGASLAADDGSGPPLVAIHDVLADVNASAPRQVVVRGVVTWRVGSGLIIQDDSGGIWVDTYDDAPPPIALECDPAVLRRLAPGLEIEVVGRTNRGGFSPNILPRTIRILGAKPEPEPRPVDPLRFMTGADDCLRVRVRAVIQGVQESRGEWRLAADDQGRRFTAVVPRWIVSERPDHLVDAEVELVGVVATRFNTRGEHRGTRLLISRAADITVVRPAVAAAFDVVAVPLAAIAHYAPTPPDGHRIRTQGVVTFCAPGRFLYLQEGMLGVRVETPSAELFALGDRVEAAGFVERHCAVAGLVGAVVRRLETGRPLAPTPITPDAIMDVNRHASYHGVMAAPGDYQGALVTFAARLIDVQKTAAGETLLMQSGSSTIVAEAGPGVVAGIRGIEPGSEFQATGIVEERGADGADGMAVVDPPPVQVRLLLRTAADLRLLRAATWWKPHRLAAALAAAAAVAGITSGWVVLLRRQVARQLALIETKLQAEAAAEERQRIAREFHDTLEQGLAGLSLRLDVAAHGTADDRMRGVLRQQRQLLAGLQTEARGFLWDLRDPVHVEGSLRESIAAQVRLLEPSSSVPLAFAHHGPSPDVAPAIQHQLVRIVREAVTNAIRHARARHIEVGLRLEQPHGGPGGVCLTVGDDGEGFDVETRSAVEGHYGLRGMRERARRIGAELTVESGPGRGTRIVVMLPGRFVPAGLGNGDPASSAANLS